MLKATRIMTCLLTILVSVNLYGAEKNDDIRVVIDVSGSMKKTDPANLRVSAMKLLNGLIPDGAQAGVWTFGKYVNMTVKWGKVNKNWRKMADLGVEEIHSNAALTNIESALARSTKGWEKPDPKMRRNLILLTDGKVDIGKDEAKNAKSRQTILDKSIKRLQQAGVNVYAIGLSKNADEVLLKRLALETDGSFEVVEKAEELQRIFFKMFERATVPDSVSIDGNQFKIDSSIKEMTLLVFRSRGSEATHLYPPKSSAISAKRPGNSIWRSDDSYDLITIKNPRKGIWNIEADIDPDNRLMVVTDLKLEVSGLPTYVTPKQSINLNAALFNKGKQIRKNSFLRFVDFNLKHISIDNTETDSALKHSKDRKQKGQYLHQFEQGLQEGTHSILVSANSRTFSRSKRFDIEVQWPVEVSIEATDSPGSYELSVKAREEYLKPESLKTTIDLQAPDGSRKPLDLVKDNGSWRAEIDTDQEGLYQAAISIEAQTQAGEATRLDLGNFSMIGVYKAPAEPVVPEQADEPQTQALNPPEIEQQESSGPDWIMTSIVIGVANLVFALIAIGVFLVMRRKPTPAEFVLE